MGKLGYFGSRLVPQRCLEPFSRSFALVFAPEILMKALLFAGKYGQASLALS